MEATGSKSERLQEGSTGGTTDLTVFRARQAFEAMEGWALSAGALELAEHEVEVELEKRSREVSRLVLQAHLNARGTGDVGRAIEVEESGETHRQKRRGRKDPWMVTSIFGKVRAVRTAYAAEERESLHPLDAELVLPKRSFSYELQRRVVTKSIRGPFDEAVEHVEETTGNRLSKRSAEQIVGDAAEDFEVFYETRKVPPPEESGPLVVGSFDGKGIPMRKKEKTEHQVRLKKGQKRNKKRMATVATVYTQARRIRTPEEVVASLFEGERPEGQERIRPEGKRVWASLERDKETVIAEGAAEMRRRDPERTKELVVLTDGEKALQLRVKKALPGERLILDLLHALERVWIAANALYKEGSEEAKEWARSHALMILQGKVSQVVKGMRQSVTKRKLRGSKKKAILKAAAYLYRNKAYMKYDEYLAAGLPIATGAVEGACKNLVKDRMERSGMRWTEAGAEAVLKLRAIERSGDLEEYWRFHIRRDQQRLYGSRPWRRVA